MYQLDGVVYAYFNPEKTLDVNGLTKQSDIEPRMRNPDFRICENTDADQLRRVRIAEQRLCFRYIVQFPFFLDPKYQASSYILRLYSLICVGPGRKSRRQISS